MRAALLRCVGEALDLEAETGRIRRKRRGWIMMLGTKKTNGDGLSFRVVWMCGCEREHVHEA